MYGDQIFVLGLRIVFPGSHMTISACIAESLQLEVTIIDSTDFLNRRQSYKMTLNLSLAGSKNRKRLDLLQMRTTRLVTLVHAYRQSSGG